MSDLRSDHTPEAIRERVAAATKHSYLGDGVLGAIDGTVTTFAIVAGATGADLSGGIALVLGLANVVADGFSMGVSNYLKARSDQAVVRRARRTEEHHIEHIPDGEREEIREIFRAKGFDGGVLDEVVDVITRDRERWIDTMVTEELGLPLETPAPVRAAGTTFLAFVVAGMLPLLPLMTVGVMHWFEASAAVAGATFVLIGFVKGRVVGEPVLRHIAETVVIGGGAAVLAYGVGHWARGLA